MEAKAAKPSLVARTRDYTGEVREELSKVHWPSRRDLYARTIMVIVLSAIVAAVLGLFDTALAWITEFLISIGLA